MSKSLVVEQMRYRYPLPPRGRALHKEVLRQRVDYAGRAAAHHRERAREYAEYAEKQTEMLARANSGSTAEETGS